MPASPHQAAASSTAQEATDGVAQSAPDQAHELASCPRCEAACDPEGDFCERCGHWLRTGQCRFCYHAIGEADRYCEECGSPQAGFTCGRCSTSSLFDFCAQCGDALSDAARAELRVLAEQLPPAAPAERTPGTHGADVASDAPPAAGSASTPTAAAALPPQRRRLFNDDVAARLGAERVSKTAGTSAECSSLTGALSPRVQTIAPVVPARIQGENRAPAPNQQAPRVVNRPGLDEFLQLSAKKAFADPQAARRHHMALLEAVKSGGRNPRGWICNRFHNLHVGPHQCAAPQFGGQWVF